MLFDIIRIGILYFEQVFIRYLLLVGAVSFFNISLQFTYRCMQVDQQVRLYQLLVNNVKQSLIKPEFILGQSYFGKQ